MRFELLEQLDEHEVALDRFAKACLQSGIDVRWQRVNPAALYLRYALESERGIATCLIDVEAWVAARLPSLPGLAWSTMDPHIQSRLFQCEKPLSFDDARLRYQRAIFVGMAGSLSGTSVLALPAAEGMVLMEHVNWALPPVEHPIELPSGLALPVEFAIGSLCLPTSRIRKLRPNDIVLIPQLAGKGKIGGRFFFNFSVNEEDCIVEQVFEDGIDDALDDDAAQQYVGLNFAGIPVRVDVLLSREQRTLSELAELAPGSVFTLGPNAYRSIALQVEGTTVAVGELVQIGEQFGVRITQQTMRP